MPVLVVNDGFNVSVALDALFTLKHTVTMYNPIAKFSTLKAGTAVLVRAIG